MTIRRKLLLALSGLAFLPVLLIAALAAFWAFRFVEARGRDELENQLTRLAGEIGQEVDVERLSLGLLLQQRGKASPSEFGAWLSQHPDLTRRLNLPNSATSRFLCLDEKLPEAVILEGHRTPHQVTLRTSRLALASLPPVYETLLDSLRRRAALPPAVTVARPHGPAIAVVVPFPASETASRGFLVEELSAIVLLRRLFDGPPHGALRAGCAAARLGPSAEWVWLHHPDPARIGMPAAASDWPGTGGSRARPGEFGGAFTVASSSGGATNGRTEAGWTISRSGDLVHATGVDPLTGWLLGASLSLAPDLDPLLRSVGFGLALLALLTVLVAVGITLVTRGIGRAVDEIGSGVAAIARGDLERTIRLRRSDEIGAIAEHVNRMGRDLVLTAESRSIAALGARLGHDLKGVASQIKLLVHNLREHYDDPEFRADFGGLMESLAEQVESLVLRLRRGGGESRPQYERLDLHRLLQGIVESRVRAAAPRIAVRTDLRGPAEIVASRELLVEAIENVMVNAVEAMDGEGTLTVRVQAAVTGGQANSVSHVIEIEDTGPGMSREFVETELFRPFGTTKPKGLGLGMYQVRGAIERMGGRIEVLSRPGSGTRVRVEVGRPE